MKDHSKGWTWIVIAVIVIAWLLLAKEYINY